MHLSIRGDCCGNGAETRGSASIARKAMVVMRLPSGHHLLFKLFLFPWFVTRVLLFLWGANDLCKICGLAFVFWIARLFCCYL